MFVCTNLHNKASIGQTTNKAETAMRIYAYLRVSTDQQADSGAGLSAQLDACKRWTEQQGHEIAGVFSDEGISGSTGLDKRPSLMEAINQLEKGDVLLVAKRDRLGRDPIAVAMIEASIQRKQAKTVSASGEGTENDDPSSILMRRMIDAFAEFERNIIKGRTKAAMQAKKARGERVGYIPFGFRLSSDGKVLEKDPQEQSILNQIRELMEDGLSTRKIAEEMNKREAFNRGGAKWNHASIHRAMMKIAA